MDKIGEGEDKKVYVHPKDESKVVARFKEKEENLVETARQIKGRFYLTKILHLIFPTSIPDVSLVAKGENTILVSEKKKLDELHKKHNKLRTQVRYENNQSPELSKEYSRIYEGHEDRLIWDDKYIDFLRDIASLGVDLDPSPSNFGYDKDKNLVYVDNDFKPWKIRTNQEKTRVEMIKNYDREQILEASDKLDEETRGKIKSHLDRLDTLFKEEQEKLGYT